MRKKRWEWQAKSVKSQAFERIHSWYFVAYFVRFFTQTKPLPPPLLSKCIKCVPLKWVYATTRKSEGGKEESTKYATCTKRSIEYARGNFIKYIAIQWFIQSDFNVLHHLFLCSAQSARIHMSGEATVQWNAFCHAHKQTSKLFHARSEWDHCQNVQTHFISRASQINRATHTGCNSRDSMENVCTLNHQWTMMAMKCNLVFVVLHMSMCCVFAQQIAVSHFAWVCAQNDVHYKFSGRMSM